MTTEWQGIKCDQIALLKATDIYRQIVDKVELPALHFKPEWDVRIIPPFAGAMMRFTVEHNGRRVSVYCDFFDHLGYFGAPYWEMYPMHGDASVPDVMRFPLEDTAGLIANIDAELRGE